MKTKLTTLFAATAALSVATADSAFARGKIPVILQITNNTTGTISDPSIRSQDGDTIVFTSNGDVTGPAPGHNEIYLWELNTGITTRLTTTTGGESREAAREGDDVGSGGRPRAIPFISTGDLDPSVGNVDGNAELFIWERGTEVNTIHQLTDTVGVTNAEPYNSDSGKCIVFTSTGNLDNNPGTESGIPPTGYSNLDGSAEVFIYSLLSAENFPNDGFFTQVSSGPVGTTSSHPVVGGYIFQRQCQTTAYVSDFDQTGDGVTGSHIFIYDRDSAKTKMMETSEIDWDPQFDFGDFLYPSISSASPFARGPFVVFQTDSDHWHNSSDGFEMFRFRVFHPRMTQYTDYMTGDVRRPVVSDGGGYIAFQSTSEILLNSRRARIGGDPPFNADGNSEIFRLRGRRKVWQITDSTGCTNDIPSVRDDATSIAFRSTCDLIPGENPGGVQQVFLYREVKGGDPLASAEGCLVANGCCNEANGCYQPIYGGKPKPRKKGCFDSLRCRDLEQ